MIEHLVLIKWKPSTSEANRRRVLSALAALKDRIPGILRYKVGENFSPRSQGFDAAISSTFADLASLQAYQPHPEHQVVATEIASLAENILALDFETMD